MWSTDLNLFGFVDIECIDAPVHSFLCEGREEEVKQGRLTMISALSGMSGPVFSAWEESTPIARTHFAQVLARQGRGQEEGELLVNGTGNLFVVGNKEAHVAIKASWGQAGWLLAKADSCLPGERYAAVRVRSPSV